MVHFSFFNEDGRFNFDHPSLDGYQPLTPAQEGEQAKVNRLHWNNRTYILKRLLSKYEYHMMEQVMKVGLPIPQIIDFIELDSTCYLLLEDVGHCTLEKAPFVLPAVIEAMILLHESTPLNQVNHDLNDGGTHIQTIHAWCDRKREILAMDDLDWDRVFASWFPNGERRRRMHRAIEESLVSKMETEHYCFSHGDIHPNNIAVRRDGSLAILDWEYAGYHSVYTDLYALFDMCYPDATSCRYNYGTMWNLKSYAKRMKLQWESFYHDYMAFRLLNHVREIVCCDRDLQNRTRDAYTLAQQVEWIYHQIRQVQEVMV